MVEEIIGATPRMHVFICVNDRCSVPGNAKSSCGPTITPEMVKEVKLWLRMKGFGGVVYCTQVKCLGFCNPDGGVMCVYPASKFFKMLRTVLEIQKVIEGEMKGVL